MHTIDQTIKLIDQLHSQWSIMDMTVCNFVKAR